MDRRRLAGSGLFLTLLAASFISPEKSRKMLPTPVGTNSGPSPLGSSLLDGNSRDSFVSRSLADVAEVSAQPCTRAGPPAPVWRLPGLLWQTCLVTGDGLERPTPGAGVRPPGLWLLLVGG